MNYAPLMMLGINLICFAAALGVIWAFFKGACWVVGI